MDVIAENENNNLYTQTNENEITILETNPNVKSRNIRNKSSVFINYLIRKLVKHTTISHMIIILFIKKKAKKYYQQII